MGKTNNDGAVSLLAGDDPLVTAAERVPLAWPRNARRAESGHGSESGVRPFGLRFAIAVPVGDPLPPWRYCPDRQITIGADGQPWHRTLAGGTMKSTGPSTDGGPSTGGEEWTPDFLSDETG